MACPECGCKETYCYDEGDDMPGGDERLERCAACGEVFDIDDADYEADDEYPETQPGAPSFDGAEAWNAYGPNTNSTTDSVG